MQPSLTVEKATIWTMALLLVIIDIASKCCLRLARTVFSLFFQAAIIILFIATTMVLYVMITTISILAWPWQSYQDYIIRAGMK